jgi:hypothetical protein
MTADEKRYQGLIQNLVLPNDDLSDLLDYGFMDLMKSLDALLEFGSIHIQISKSSHSIVGS